MLDLIDDEYINSLILNNEDVIYDFGQNESYAFCHVYNVKIILYHLVNREILKFGDLVRKDNKELVMACNDKDWYA